MARRRARVSDLAAEAGLDLDEAVVTLWDAGLDGIEEGRDFVPTALLSAARRALGLETREQFNVDYWLAISGLPREKLAKRLLDEAGVTLTAQARRIPKNSLRRLRRMFDAASVVQEETKPPPQPVGPIEWRQIGHNEPARYLGFDEVKGIHEALEQDFASSIDPIYPPGLRDGNLLQSALTRPLTSFENALKYKTVEMAGAALFHSLVHNHAFHNGNKRTALVSLLAFLDENGTVLTSNQKDLFRFTLRAAQHRLVPESADQMADREVLEIARWISSHSRPIERGERPMKWLRLKQRLRDFDCVWEPARGVGNRLNISRTVETRRRFGPRKKRELHTQVRWRGDGTEADRNTLQRIRKELELNDANDCDSATFYAGAEIDSFIIDYRRILQRLAKL